MSTTTCYVNWIVVSECSSGLGNKDLGLARAWTTNVPTIALCSWYHLVVPRILLWTAGGLMKMKQGHVVADAGLCAAVDHVRLVHDPGLIIDDH